MEDLAKGKISVKEAESLLRVQALREVGDVAKLDVFREWRKGIPEIVIAEGKAPEDTAKIVLRILEVEDRAIVSRVSKGHLKALKGALENFVLEWNEKGKIAVIRKRGVVPKRTGGRVGILTAGTADIPVAEEARVVAEEMGCRVLKAYDVGVAGVHRLFPHLESLLKSGVDVIIVVAGMEGALPSVVAGLVDVPVIGVPTSRGYGVGGGGIGALISMLQSCSLGLLVVNIDNGVAAGATAALISNRIARFAGKSR